MLLEAEIITVFKLYFMSLSNLFHFGFVLYVVFTVFFKDQLTSLNQKERTFINDNPHRFKTAEDTEEREEVSQLTLVES